MYGCAAPRLCGKSGRAKCSSRERNPPAKSLFCDELESRSKDLFPGAPLRVALDAGRSFFGCAILSRHLRCGSETTLAFAGKTRGPGISAHFDQSQRGTANQGRVDPAADYR